MEWLIIVTAILAIAVIYLGSMFRSLVIGEMKAREYILMLILQDETYREARINLSNLVASTDAKGGATEFAKQVFSAVGKWVAKTYKPGLLSPELLWQMKMGNLKLQIPPPTSTTFGQVTG